MRRMAALEKNIVGRIMAALRKHPHIVVRKRHGTAMGVAGDPDLYGTINGRHFEIEVKRPGEQLTEIQTRRLLEWKLAGATTGVAHSADEALAIVGLRREWQEERAVWICSGCHNYRWEGSEAPARCPNCSHTRFEKEAVA